MAKHLVMFLDSRLEVTEILLKGRKTLTYPSIHIFGQQTCFQYNGNSVVDNCIVSESLFRNVLFFMFKSSNHF